MIETAKGVVAGIICTAAQPVWSLLLEFEEHTVDRRGEGAEVLELAFVSGADGGVQMIVKGGFNRVQPDNEAVGLAVRFYVPEVQGRIQLIHARQKQDVLKQVLVLLNDTIPLLLSPIIRNLEHMRQIVLAKAVYDLAKVRVLAVIHLIAPFLPICTLFSRDIGYQVRG